MQFTHLDEGDLAGADVALEVADGDLPVMLQVTLLTEDIMDAGHHLVPLIVVVVPGQKNPNRQKNPLKFGQLGYYGNSSSADCEVTHQAKKCPTFSG